MHKTRGSCGENCETQKGRPFNTKRVHVGKRRMKKTRTTKKQRHGTAKVEGPKRMVCSTEVQVPLPSLSYVHKPLGGGKGEKTPEKEHPLKKGGSPVGGEGENRRGRR